MPAQHLHHDTLEGLRRGAQAECRGQVLDLVAVELLPMALADLVDQPELQRQDGDVGQAVRQDLERAGQDGLLHDEIGGGDGGRGGRDRDVGRQRPGGLVELGHRRRRNPQRVAQLLEKSLFRRTGESIGVADGERRLIGQAAGLVIRELSSQVGDSKLATRDLQRETADIG